MVKLLILFIFVFNIITRFWKIGEIPPVIDGQYYSLRILSVGLNLLIPVLFYYFVHKIYNSNKLALLSALFLSLLPQSIVEGRIVSVLVNPHLSVFREIAPVTFFMNFLHLISFDMLFFQNVTFYWGGVRETGIMYLSFLPFFITGIYSLIENRSYKPLFFLLAVLILISFSPEFPENRFIFFIFPILSLISAGGVLAILKNKNTYALPLLTLIFLYFQYELIQFFHFYFVHYPLQVSGFSQKIIGPF